jgi:hypothetical protein
VQRDARHPVKRVVDKKRIIGKMDGRGGLHTKTKKRGLLFFLSSGLMVRGPSFEA